MQNRLCAADLAKCFNVQDIPRRGFARLASRAEAFASGSGESLEARQLSIHRRILTALALADRRRRRSAARFFRHFRRTELPYPDLRAYFSPIPLLCGKLRAPVSEACRYDQKMHFPTWRRARQTSQKSRGFFSRQSQ